MSPFMGELEGVRGEIIQPAGRGNLAPARESQDSLRKKEAN
jgi:hypothetical protein